MKHKVNFEAEFNQIAHSQETMPILENAKDAPLSLLFVIISLAISALLYIQIIEPSQIYFDKKLIFEEHEYWRLFTSILSFGPFSSSMMIHFLLFADYLFTIEHSYFVNRPFDFLIFNLFGWTCLLIYAYFVPTLFLSNSYDVYITYYYSKRANDFHVGLFGLAAFVPYIPYLLLIFYWFQDMKTLFFTALIGYGSSHLYYFIKDVISLRYDITTLAVPDALNNAFLRFLS